MTRMMIDKGDRPKVKVECLRLLATLRLDPAKSELIGVFIDTYLKLTAAEMKVYEREIEALAPEEKGAAMEMVTSWHKEGRAEGKAEGKAEGLAEGRMEGEREILILLGAQRLGDPDQTILAALEKITSPIELKSLASRLLEAESWQELLSGR